MADTKYIGYTNIYIIALNTLNRFTTICRQRTDFKLSPLVLQGQEFGEVAQAKHRQIRGKIPCVIMPNIMFRKGRTFPGILRGRTRSTVARRSIVTISEEILQAKSENRPIVALESTIISHGLPFPANLEMAMEVEKIVRNGGAVPATCAFIQGTPKVGLDQSDLTLLADKANAVKVSRRDISVVMSRKLNGGTTIAGTMILADMAGIKVFSTGGLGGVHRGVEQTMDVSADLDELARTSVAVVCSGPKSILDIPRTIEYLETQGVPVFTLNENSASQVDVPGFYSRESGVLSPYSFSGPADAARIIQANAAMNLRSGMVFCNPAPQHLALDKDYMDSIIEASLIKAEKFGIKGKEITPFLLNAINEATNGASVKTNVEFVKNNALISTKIARELVNLEQKSCNYFKGASVDGSSKTFVGTDVGEHDVLVVGAMAVDLTCTLSENVFKTSNKASIKTSVGGVGHNIALASALGGTSTKLVSALDSNDYHLLEQPLKSDGIISDQNIETPRYVAFHDHSGDLIMACADMSSIENLSVNHISSQIEKTKPKIVVFDGNIGTEQIRTVVTSSRIVNAQIVFEPTSVIKAREFTSIINPPDVFPDNLVDIATPNLLELSEIAVSLGDNGLYDVDYWFPVIDALDMNQNFRMKMEEWERSRPALRGLLSKGYAQEAARVLPYIPKLAIKLGSNGLLFFQIVHKDDYVPLESNTDILSAVFGKKDIRLVVEHYPVMPVPTDSVRSVTGAGDTLCGILVSQIAKTNSVNWQSQRENIFNIAQSCARLTVQSHRAVSPDLPSMFNS